MPEVEISPEQARILEREAYQTLTECKTEDSPLDCIVELLETLPEAKGFCKPQLYLLTQEGCPVCEEDRERFKDLLTKGIITEIDVSAGRGKTIAEKHGFNFTPTLALLDCKDELIAELSQ